MSNNNSPHTPAVDRAFDVIDIIAANKKEEVSLAEIMEQSHIPRQSLIRILNTLCDRGIIDRTSRRGFYRMGMKLLYLGSDMEGKMALRTKALPLMKELGRATRKTIELITLDRDQLILIEQIEGSEGVRLYSRVGGVFPYFHANGAGKIYLAHMQPDKRHSVLEKLGMPAMTKYTITKRNKLEEELLKFHRQGYVFENQEMRDGVRRVVAPICDKSDELVGCIGIAAPIFSFSSHDQEDLGRIIVDAAGKITEKLKHEGNVPNKRT